MEDKQSNSNTPVSSDKQAPDSPSVPSVSGLTDRQDDSVQHGPSNPDRTKKPEPSEEALVKSWLAKIKTAKDKMQLDFDRMKDNQRFARGLQWQGQTELDFPKYVVNLTLQAINKGVASLYARNPKVDTNRRERMDYAIWDERIETLAAAQADVGMNGPNANPMSQMILMDYQMGRQWKDSVDRMGRIIRIVVQYMFDAQQPSFKEQMKQLVRRVKTNGVGYVRRDYEESFDQILASTSHETENTLSTRLKSIQHIVTKYEKDKLRGESKEIEVLRQLALSVGQSLTNGDMQNLNERIVFSFPPSNKVIVDPRCRQLKGFVGAHWILQEHNPSLEFINEFFELTGGERELNGQNVTSLARENGQEWKPAEINEPASDDVSVPHGCLYEVFDLDTKTTFFVLAGCKWFIQAPEALEPETNSFWPIKALTFNDVECEPDTFEGGDSTLFPPSDVDLLRSIQKEYNRTREAWRWQRIANAPKYMTGKGWLSNNDKNNINNAEENTILELEGAPMGSDINKMLAPFRFAPFDQAMYDTSQLTMVDMGIATGMQQDNIGMNPQRGTATGQTIAEQSRVSGLSSNVDDLDMLLSCLAQDCGEITLRRFKKDTIVRIAGRGASLVWPDNEQLKEDFINEIYLDTVAASSGRPNQALKVAECERLAPIAINAGANPVGILEWIKDSMGADVDLDKFFPIQAPPSTPMNGQATRPAGGGPTQPTQQKGQGQPQRQQQKVARPSQPLQSLPHPSPVPLAAA